MARGSCATAAGTTLSNNATASSTTQDPEPANNTDAAALVVAPQADLSVVKRASATTVNLFEDVTYTLTAANAGPNEATGVTVSDPVPAGMLFVSADPAASSTAAPRSVTCAIGTLASGESQDVTITLRPQPPNAGQTVLNSAFVTGDQPDPDLADNTGDARIFVPAEAGRGRDRAVRNRAPPERLTPPVPVPAPRSACSYERTRQPGHARWLHTCALPLRTALLAALIAPAAALVSGCGGSDRPADRPMTPTPAASNLQQRLDAVVSAGTPGVISLVNDGHTVTVRAAGVADVRNERPLRAQDRFRAGSITKSYVAVVAVQLVDEGRLSLADTVERWLPGILSYGGQVNMRQLLNLTSGVPDDHRPIKWRSTWRPAALLGARELVALIADQPQEFPAGPAWAYSNTDYVLAGMIIEPAPVTASPRSSSVTYSGRSGCAAPRSPSTRPRSRAATQTATRSTTTTPTSRSKASCSTSRSSTRPGPGRPAISSPPRPTSRTSGAPCSAAGCSLLHGWPR